MHTIKNLFRCAFVLSLSPRLVALVPRMSQDSDCCSVNDGPLALARSMGLDLFNSIPAIKNHASAVAMGTKA